MKIPNYATLIVTPKVKVATGIVTSRTNAAKKTF